MQLSTMHDLNFVELDMISTSLAPQVATVEKSICVAPNVGVLTVFSDDRKPLE